ncbi:MAG: hypothetical protein H7Y86_03865 [Rhizobacter sp.]|nr:hypothetical protein [Ferruginibacter sp.]
MKKNRKIYSVFQQASAIFLVFALLWLTISIPFVYASQQELAKQNKAANAQFPLSGNEEEAANPFGNTTEEKAPGNSSSVSEEYLHDNHIAHYIFSIALRYHKSENAGTYNAFHGEVQVPPPNA